MGKTTIKENLKSNWTIKAIPMHPFGLSQRKEPIDTFPSLLSTSLTLSLIIVVASYNKT